MGVARRKIGHRKVCDVCDRHGRIGTGVCPCSLDVEVRGEVSDVPRRVGHDSRVLHAASNAHLYLWVTNAKLLDYDYAHLFSSWGFAYKTALTWHKTSCLGIGHYFRGETEHVLFGIRGRLPIEPALRERNLFQSPRTRHSAKPDAFFDLVERVSPGPYLELFARRQRLGWDTWGNEALEHVTLDVERATP